MGAEFFPRLVIAVIVVLAVCIAFGIGSPPMEKPAASPAQRLDYCRAFLSLSCSQSSCSACGSLHSCCWWGSAACGVRKAT